MQFKTFHLLILFCSFSSLYAQDTLSYGKKRIIIKKQGTDNRQICDQNGKVLKTNVYDVRFLSENRIGYRQAGVYESPISVMDTNGNNIKINYFHDLAKSKNGYFAGYTNDSTHIYDGNFNYVFSAAGHFLHQNERLFTEKNLLIAKGKNSMYLSTLSNQPVTRSYANVYYHEAGVLTVYGQNDSAAVIDMEGKEIIPLKKQSIQIINDKIFVTPHSKSEKKSVGVSIFDTRGTKINKHPVHFYHQSYNYFQFYFLENDKTKKRGYFWNGILMDAIYDDVSNCTLGHEQFAILVEKNKIRLFNKNGTDVFKTPFESIYAGKNHAIVKLNGKYGIIGSKNNQPDYIIQPLYDEIPVINSTLPQLIAVKKDGSYFYINTQEEPVISGDFDYLSQFDNNEFAIAGKNKKRGVINKDGSWKIQPDYDYLDYYYNDTNLVVFPGRKNKKVVLLNEKGTDICPADTDSLSFEYLMNINYIAVIQNKKTGIIDYNGKIILPVKFRSIYEFYIANEEEEKELLSVQDENGYGFYDNQGRAITECVYDKFYDNDELYIAANLNLIPVRKGGKQGAINFDGKEILPCIYENILWHEDEGMENRAKVKYKGKWGLIGKNGNKITECIYDDIVFFWELNEFFNYTDTMIFYIVKQNGKKGLIRTDGTTIFPSVYSDFAVFYDCESTSLIQLKSEKMQGAGDLDGKLIIPAVYDNIECAFGDAQNYLMCWKNKKVQVFNAEGKPVNDKFYDAIDWIGYEHLAAVKTGNKWYYLDVNGNESPADE